MFQKTVLTILSLMLLATAAPLSAHSYLIHGRTGAHTTYGGYATTPPMGYPVYGNHTGYLPAYGYYPNRRHGYDDNPRPLPSTHTFGYYDFSTHRTCLGTCPDRDDDDSHHPSGHRPHGYWHGYRDGYQRGYGDAWRNDGRERHAPRRTCLGACRD